MASNLDGKLRELGYDIIHVGQFDLNGLFRERRLRREQFLAWAQNPRFANVIIFSMIGFNSLAFGNVVLICSCFKSALERFINKALRCEEVLFNFL